MIKPLYKYSHILLPIAFLLLSILLIVFRKDISFGANTLSTAIFYNFPKQEIQSLNNKVATFSEALGNENVFYVEIADTAENRPLEFKEEVFTLDNYPKGYSYFSEGEVGNEFITRKDIAIKTNKVVFKKTSFLMKEVTKNPVTNNIYEGSATIKDLTSAVTGQIKEKIENFDIKEQLVFQDLTLRVPKSFDINKNSEAVNFAEIKVVYKECNYFIRQKIFYNTLTNTYAFTDLDKIQKNVCNKQYKFPNLVERATCVDDCTLYPIDKTTFVPKTYVFEALKLTAINDLHQIAKIAHDDFVRMYKAAEKAGHDIHVTSAWRTFKDQESTFEYWVKREMNLFGVDRRTAEMRANRYSAMPGFSEHQLGTTVDLNAESCEAFEGYCQANENLWAWLASNAHKYGFVLSYPKNREADTGYVAEAWHYRWLGEDLAAKYKKQEGKLTLNKWLRNIAISE